jgi:hypothetical protein
MLVRIGVALVGVAGCDRSRPPEAPPAPSSPAVADTAAIPHDAAPPPDAASLAALDASQPPDATITTTGLQPGWTHAPGRGTCRVDGDCVLTSYQEGCCVGACQAYASSQRDLDARQAKEDCVAWAATGQPCPPPAPCRGRTTKSVAAVCKAGRCTTVLAPLAP